MITRVEDPLEGLLDGRAGQPRFLIEVLQDVQERDGFISEQVMTAVSERLRVPPIEVYRVANYYKAFSLKPRGKHVITVCTGTACHVRGASPMLEEVAGQLGIRPGETTDDQQFTVESVACLGACALGPVVVLDGVYHHHMTPAKLRKLILSVRQPQEEVAADANA